MNRAEFQLLSDIRLDEAKTLLDQGKADGAYYLAGYAVECGLKACIAKLTNQFDFPPDKAMIDKCYSHNIERLVTAANMQTQLDAQSTADAGFQSNWGIVKDWSEKSRYDRKTLQDAQQLYDAINDPKHGVLAWIKKLW